MTLARDLTSAARVIEAGRKYQLEAAEAIRFALDILALGDARRGETMIETGDRELIRRASLPATRIDGAAGESPEQGQDASAAAADVVDMAPRNPGKSVRDGEGGDALPEPDAAPPEPPAAPDDPPVGELLIQFKELQMIGPAGRQPTDSRRAVRLLDALATGDLMFVPDVAKHLGMNAGDARDLLNNHIFRLNQIGLRLAWQGRDFVRLETLDRQD